MSCKLRLLALFLVVSALPAQAQRFALGEGPWEFPTYSPDGKIKVSVVVRGITKAFGMAFLPNGDILVAESAGKLRLIRGGKLVNEAITGVPAVARGTEGGLMDVVLHPDFAHNHLVYFTYIKPGKGPNNERYYATTALGRGKLNDAETALTDVKDVYVADAWGTATGGHGSRVIFAPDGTLFFSSPFRHDFERPQLMDNDISKLLHLKDDGTIPADNPFVGKPGYKGEIWSLGHRTIEGMAFNPRTGDLWASEHGPQGGDEVNIIRKGANYGWPLVSFGRDYDGTRISPSPVKAGMTLPEIIWVPSIATSGLMFYTGDKFPKWKNNMFVGGLMKGRVAGTGHMERIEFNADGEQKRESLLTELHQRIRDVQQGPDGYLYVLTDEDGGALLKVEPVQ